MAPHRYERPTRTFFVFDLLLDLEDGVGRRDIERDSLASDVLDVQQHRAVDGRADACRHLGIGCIGGSRVSHMARGHVGSLFRESDRSSINEGVVAMAYE